MWYSRQSANGPPLSDNWARRTRFSLSTRAVQSWLFFLRNEGKLTKVQLKYLSDRNLRSKAAIISKDGPVVSLTTYGDRIQSVHLAIESIAAGSMLPSKLILWVDHLRSPKSLPDGLKRLVDRGLDIRLTKDFGPHTKYFPYVLMNDSFRVPLVTADDDQLYSKWWLRGLAESYLENSAEVSCYRAHTIALNNETISPYRSWKVCTSASGNFLHYATGVSGCIYPSTLLEQVKAAGTDFMQLCPKSDDTWLHVNALRAGVKVRQVWNRPLRFPVIPGTQAVGLYHDNVLLSENDRQIQRTYLASDIATLNAASR